MPSGPLAGGGESAEGSGWQPASRCTSSPAGSARFSRTELIGGRSWCSPPSIPVTARVTSTCCILPAVVAGDRLEVEARLSPAARVLLTTPAANKLYRSEGATADVVHRLSVAAGAALEWLPQETIAFPGARARTLTRVDLEPGSRFIGWESWCLGLPARSEPFRRGELDQWLHVYREGEPLLLERQRLDARAPVMCEAWGLAGYPNGGTLLAHPGVGLDVAREATRTFTGGPADVTVVENLLVVRAMSESGVRLQALFRALWASLRPAVIGARALAPRVWAT